MVETRLRSNSNNLELHEVGNACWVLYSNHLTDSNDSRIFLQKTPESKTKSGNDVKVRHLGECNVNPQAGKLAINMDEEANSERTFIVLGNCPAFHMNRFENCRSVIMIKSCKPGMQITTSEETTLNQFVFRDALSTCLE